MRTLASWGAATGRVVLGACEDSPSAEFVDGSPWDGTDESWTSFGTSGSSSTSSEGSSARASTRPELAFGGLRFLDFFVGASCSLLPWIPLRPYWSKVTNPLRGSDTTCRDPPPSPSLISTSLVCVWTINEPHGRHPRWWLTTCTANATHSLAQLVSKTKSNPSTLA